MGNVLSSPSMQRRGDAVRAPLPLCLLSAAAHAFVFHRGSANLAALVRRHIRAGSGRTNGDVDGDGDGHSERDARRVGDASDDDESDDGADDTELGAFARDVLAFVGAYSLDVAVALAGRSTLYLWTPAEVLVHHFAGIAGPSAVLCYDLLMRRPGRPRHQTLGKARLFLVSSLLTCVNESASVVLNMWRRPSERVTEARKLLGFLAVLQVFVAEWVTYVGMMRGAVDAALARLRRRGGDGDAAAAGGGRSSGKPVTGRPVPEVGEALLVQSVFWCAWLHLGYLRGYVAAVRGAGGSG